MPEAPREHRIIRLPKAATVATIIALAVPPATLGYLGFDEGKKVNRNAIKIGTQDSVDDSEFADVDAGIGAFIGLVISTGAFVGFKKLR